MMSFQNDNTGGGALKTVKESITSGTVGAADNNKQSLGTGSANLTYSTIANVPKAKKQKLISEAKPMVIPMMLFYFRQIQ